MKANRSSLILILAALALAPFPAGAQGPTNINNCTTIAQPGAYELTRNLDATGDCLVIAADFVTIDLKGFVISGNGTGAGISNAGKGRLGTAIRNGTITNFLDGINFAAIDGANQSTEVQQIRAIANARSGIALNENAIVSGCTASGNGGTGIGAGANSTLTGNNASGNHTGFDVSVRSLLSGNTASDNGPGGIGIIISCPSNLVGNAAIANNSNIIEIGVGCTRANNNPAP
jgi:parallel beta-helix repeat protein